MRRRLTALMVILVNSTGALGLAQSSVAGSKFEDLVQLLEKNSCISCKLQDADLMHADLRDANLENAKLQREIGRAHV